MKRAVKSREQLRGAPQRGGATFKVRTEGGRVASPWEIRGKALQHPVIEVS